MSGQKRCPICGETLRSGLCPACGYDVSRDYVRWPTLQPLPDRLRTVPGRARVKLSQTRAETNTVKRYRKAAERGDADGQYHLGTCYYNGDTATV